MNSTLQNRINKSIIFNYLRDHGPSYRAQISKDLSFSVPAVSRAIETLLGEDYIAVGESVITANGKATTQYRVNSSKGYVVGVDLIKDRTRFAVCDLGGHIVRSVTGSRFDETGDPGQTLIENVRRVVNGNAGTDTAGGNQGLKAIAVGIPAIVDPVSGEVRGAPLYGNLETLSPKPLLEEEFGVPVYVENVVKLSALGEMTFGAGKHASDLVFVEISNGIGAGIILDNQLWRGHLGSAGEIGFSVFEPRSIGFTNNTKGWLETVASVQAIRDQYVERLGADPSHLGTATSGEITAAGVCERAVHGDKFAGEVVHDIADTLSLAVIQLTLILNPQLVILGGDLCDLPHVDELFVKPLRENLEKSTLFDPPTIDVSALGDDAGVVGAALLAVESLLTGEFPYAVVLSSRSGA